MDITLEARNLIVKAYGEYRDGIYETESDNGHKLIVKSKILSALSFGYNKVIVESPQLDAEGNPIIKRGKMQADVSKRDSENIPLDEDMDEYLAREVTPYSPNAWIDHSKDKVGYEIPFTRIFYEYKVIESSQTVAERIRNREKELSDRIQSLFENED